MTGPPSPKRQRTGEKEEAPVDTEKIQKVLENVAKVDEEIDAENDKMSREILVIESKYNTVKRPFYEKRAKLLHEIPGFWKQALNNHPYVAASIADDEEKIFDFLKDLDVKFVDQSGGFKIELTFEENPYFAKGVMWKQITFKEDEEVEVTASEIKWKSTPEGKKRKENSPFFSWFSSTDGDHEVAEMIKDDVWKNPVQLYMNEADDSEEEGDEEEGDEDDEEDEEGEGEGEDEEAAE